MRTPRLREAANQHGILSIEKDHARAQHLPDALENLGQAVEGGAFANVHHDGSMFGFLGFADQTGKLGQQFERQIVDAVISQIFKSLERRSLARTGDAGDDHQLPGGPGESLMFAAGYLGLGRIALALL